jgi:hypothetical protein
MSKLAGNDWLSKTLVMQVAVEHRLEALQTIGFRPAYFDYATCTVHPSRHADGQPANDHVLDGLPDAAVAVRSDCGRVVAAKATLIAGFERSGYFYTQSAAWRAAREWGCAA